MFSLCPAAVSFHHVSYPSSESFNTKHSKPGSLQTVSSFPSLDPKVRGTKTPCSSEANSLQHITAPPAGSFLGQRPIHPDSQRVDSTKPQAEVMAAEVVQQVLSNALKEMNGQSQTTTVGCPVKSGEQTHCGSTGGSCERHERVGGKEERDQESQRDSGEKTNGPQKKSAGGKLGTDQENILDICCHGPRCHGTRPRLCEFRDFLQGTPGEKLLHLWMDIERLKVTQSRERKKR